MEHKHSRRIGFSRGAAQPAFSGRHRGHSHFWERAFSRRRFIQTGAAAGLFLFGAGRWAPASGAVAGATPKPIPGGFVFGPPVGDTLFHNFAPNVFDLLNTDPSAIFDFDGDIGYAVVDGTGTGRNRFTHTEMPLFFETDLRFMQGAYVGEDGKRHRGTFCLI